jgi:hypothetical protein
MALRQKISISVMLCRTGGEGELAHSGERMRYSDPVEMPVRRVSICPCGFRTLEDEIEAGTLYLVYMETVRTGSIYICGGCGLAQSIWTVEADQKLNPDLPPAPLPLGLFAVNNSVRRTH